MLFEILTNLFVTTVTIGVGYYFFRPYIAREAVKIATDVINAKETEDAISELITKGGTSAATTKLMTIIMDDPQTHEHLAKMLMKLLHDAQLKHEIYSSLKALLLDMIQDQEIEKILVDFISRTFMSALDQPVNEKYIKDKIVEITISDAVLDSITESLKVVAVREDVKKVMGDSAIEAVVTAIQERYPRLGKYL